MQCLGPAIKIRLHLIRGQLKTLQEAIAYAVEVDAVLESAASKAPHRRVHVHQVEGKAPEDENMTSFTKQIESMSAAFKALEKSWNPT